MRGELGLGRLGLESRVLVPTRFGLSVVASAQCLLLPIELGSQLRRLGQVALDSMLFELSEFELLSLHPPLRLLGVGWVSLLLLLMELWSCLKKLELLVVEWWV